jgi:phosphate transport system substrate-binding protein
VSGGGSGTGLAALVNGTTDIANASRKIKDEEKENALKNGIDPYEIEIARDAIGVVVNPENPVQQLTLQQISDIYSGKVTNWKDVGGEDRPIVLLSRESNSGTHVYFLEQVVRLGSSKDKTLFSQDTLLLPSSEGIIAEVRQNPNAIGYDGLGYITPEVKTLAVAPKDGAEYVKPSVETVNNGKYAIARPLFMYTPGEPKGDVKNYLTWVLSPEGQKIVGDLGFVPLK